MMIIYLFIYLWRYAISAALQEFESELRARASGGLAVCQRIHYTCFPPSTNLRSLNFATIRPAVSVLRINLVNQNNKINQNFTDL